MINISVIICAYNQGKWIERCLRSISNQKYVPLSSIEIVLVNDGSKDYTNEIIKKYQNVLKNFRVIRNKKNIGLPGSINKAVKASLGRYVIRIDSDDYVEPEILFFLKYYLDKNRAYQAVASDYYKVDKNESLISKHSSETDEIACGIMFRKDFLFETGLYDEEFRAREEEDLRIRFLKKYNIHHLEVPLYRYRIHGNNLTNDKSQMDRHKSLLNEKHNK